MTPLLIGVVIFIIVGLYGGYREAENKKRYLTVSVAGLTVVILSLFLFGPLTLLSPLKPGFTKIKTENIVIDYPDGEKLIPLRRTADGRQQKPTPTKQQTVAQMALTYTQQAVKKNQDFYKIPVKAKVLLVFDQNNLFSHELSHRTIRNLLGPINSLKLPTWFDEGMATYIANQNHYLSENEARDLLVKGQFNRNLSRREGFLGHLRWKFTGIQRDRKIYGHVYLFMKYLFNTYGEEKIYRMILAIKTSSFTEAFRNILGITPDQAHENFIASLSSE